MQVSYHKKTQQCKYLIAMASHMAIPFSYSRGFTFVCEISENAPIKFTCPTVLHCVYMYSVMYMCTRTYTLYMLSLSFLSFPPHL